MACAGHGYVVDLFDVAREDGVYAIADGSMDGFMGALGSGGGSKDKHVEVVEEPPEGGGFDRECVRGGDCVDGVGL